MTRVEVLGVRHHGPGSARSVARALDELEPDVVVIEGPPELDALVPLAADPDLVPPVAGLVYAVDEPRKAAFYPFAVFSPEWVALQWAITHGVDVRFADLPATHHLAGGDEAAPRRTGRAARPDHRARVRRRLRRSRALVGGRRRAPTHVVARHTSPTCARR